MSGTIVFDDTVSSTVRPLLGPPLGWVVIPSVLYMWVGCTVHVSFTGWALPTQYLSLSRTIVTSTGLVKIYKNWIILFFGCCDTIDSVALWAMEE